MKLPRTSFVYLLTVWNRFSHIHVIQFYAMKLKLWYIGFQNPHPYPCQEVLFDVFTVIWYASHNVCQKPNEVWKSPIESIFIFDRPRCTT